MPPPDMQTLFYPGWLRSAAVNSLALQACQSVLSFHLLSHYERPQREAFGYMPTGITEQLPFWFVKFTMILCMETTATMGFKSELNVQNAFY